MRIFFCCLLSILCYVIGTGQSLPSPSAERYFWDRYQLPGKAANQVNAHLQAPAAAAIHFPRQAMTVPLWQSRPATDLLASVFPSFKPGETGFTWETGILYHLDHPAELLWFQEQSPATACLPFFIGISGDRLYAGLGQDTICLEIKLEMGWKERWTDLVVTGTDRQLSFFINGQEKGKIDLSALKKTCCKAPLHAAHYTADEPYMVYGDIVKWHRHYDKALSPAQVTRLWEMRQEQITGGILYPGRLHWVVAPYLHLVTPRGVSLAWESDQPVSACIYYGTELPLTRRTCVESATETIRQATLNDLQADQSYFYEVVLKTPAGDSIRSGVQTFRTAPVQARPFSFAWISDTEARPFINNRTVSMIWGERPEFIINSGDLTDGGKACCKYELTMEYFQGIQATAGRIPSLTVPGNGEDDLLWYNQYHAYPGDYYSYEYANANFFMLNSNDQKGLQPGGAQYEWLRKELSRTTGRWKIVVLHHAPYSSDENDYGDTWKTRSAGGDTQLFALRDLLESQGVHLVLYGHLHIYERSRPIRGQAFDPEGTVYITGGGAGGNLEDFAPTRSWFTAKTFRGHHYCMLHVDAGSLTIHAYDLEGHLIDTHTINRKP